jgi:formylglycine-generating enzyme required for sulfatase activity
MMGDKDQLEATENYTPAAGELTALIGPAAVLATPEQPAHIGRYRVERLIGEGGFGLVYLAHDDQLQRHVAIKVPDSKLVDRTEDAEDYLTEARAVANLDHPNIVPVHDVGSAEDFPCFIVSKFIDGTDLATRLKQSGLSLRETVELVAKVADALHHAHMQGLVHRDIKPGNILLDKSGKPFLADFGLALREQDLGKGPRYAGTPAYMSPEQARGEGHRVDCRSDIFSLGIVLYELLTGGRPFKADSQPELLEQITSSEVRSPCQVDDAIPKELERICLKALSKRISERYATAKEFAEEVRIVLARLPSAGEAAVSGQEGSEGGVTTLTPTPMTSLSMAGQPVKIVPKGLRSFDETDADFFLELLPGPRDRDGIPESIRFWKSRVEATNPDLAFPVGLLYGPSGCGKSSLVKAGLLPRLAKPVTAVYVEATGEETEACLLKGLRRQLPYLPANLGLIESLASLRRGRFLESGRKVLLVLDQFEQWLHANRNEKNLELAHALRHCDGGRLQAVVMVRDDFWLAVSRFMQALEVEILEGRNSALVDLFDPLHAHRVLAAFGRAYARLPDNLGQCSEEQNAFLDQAVAGLAQDGKVISVRLALFAEMVKGKEWTPATLKIVGGTAGVGVTFLEETFAASMAPPRHRLHQKASRGVLRVLLPEAGTDIKGHMRSKEELRDASGYVGRPEEFEELLRILDRELRLITPTDPESKDDAPRSTVQAGGKYYQLTHDYLVHSLRDWLTRKQRETRRGRAELLLADRAAVWNARPENRQLPSLLQWLDIRGRTASKSWTPAQRMMMRKAGRFHLVRGLLVAALLALFGYGVYESHGRVQALALRRSLLDASTNEVPGIVRDMGPYRRWIDRLLRQDYGKAAADKDARKQLHASLALLPVDATQVKFLYGRLLDAEPHEVPVIRDALAPHKDGLLNNLWGVVEKPDKGREAQRLRAAAALATYAPKSDRWNRSSKAVVGQLVAENPVFLGLWTEAFRPIRRALLAPLATFYRDPNGRESERTLATSILADYAADNPRLLADLLMDADLKQFTVIDPKLEAHGEEGLPMLKGEIDRKLPSDAKDDAKEKLAKRQANAALALLRMHQPAKVWPLLEHSGDPRVRSYLIHRLPPLGVDARTVVNRLEEEPDVTIRRALILCLGEFGEEELAAGAGDSVRERMKGIYRNELDPGLHASAEWLLRQWRQEAWLRQVNDEWAKDKAQSEGRLRSIERLLAKDKENALPLWYVNGQGQTMVVIPGPAEFVMGSPLGEQGRFEDEPQHKKRIGRTFAVAAKPVTVQEYRRYDTTYPFTERYAPAPDCPVVETSWFQAAAYCNWLSKQEGIPESQWCYESLLDPRSIPALAIGGMGLFRLPSGQAAILATCALYPGRTDPHHEGPVKLVRDHLHRQGYRLPTEAEMEYATRSGTVTAYYYGATEDLLPKYAWYQKNAQERTWPVGRLKPNDWGLFDTLGNAWTWCQESYKEYPIGKGEQAVEDREDEELVPESTVGRVLRGGTFFYQAPYLRSANRSKNVPLNRFYDSGFRVARTLAIGSSQESASSAKPQAKGTERALPR